MILLVSALEQRERCAAALKEAMGEPVVIAENLLQATTLLRAEVFTAAIFDDQLAQSEPDEIETALKYVGTAVPLEINLGISGPERLAREVRAGARRRKHEEEASREAAVLGLRRELNGTLTTLLLDCELALETSGLPAKATERLVSVHGAAQKLRSQLAGSAAAGA
jgi:hypothetical protein